jgi:hypothetical protein
VAPSYQGVERVIAETRAAWARPGTVPQPNAPGWNALFDALRAECHDYATAPSENDRLVALNRVYQISAALGGITWGPARALREELRAWLRPRVRLAWAERRLIETVRGLPPTTDPAAQANRARWVDFVGDPLGAALRDYNAAATTGKRQEGLARIDAALAALRVQNQARPWVPSLALERALSDLYDGPNLDIVADVAALAPALEANVVTSGPIYRKGYVSQVTAGPKTGFGLLPSDDGIAFYNRQMMASVTPIWDFQHQIERDRRGRRAARLYHFDATTQDWAELTIVAVLRTTGLQLWPEYAHNVDALIGSMPMPGGGVGRLVAAAIGFNQRRITQKVYEGAIGSMRQNVVTEAAELGAERTAQAAAERNVQLAKYLVGNNTLILRNLAITGLNLRSRPEHALIGGTLRWQGAADQVGADAPQPARFAVPEAGISADVHLGSILTSLTRGYLQSDAVRDVENLMIVTRKIPPNTPPREGILVTRNVDFATFSKAMAEARLARDPKVLAIRVKRPGRAPQFAADARGYLVALVHDFLVDVPAPPAAARGGIAGPPAQVYRITAPQAEFVISFQVTPESQKQPIRLAGRLEGFDPGPGARVYAINQDETKAAPLTAFTSTIVLGVIRSRLMGQPIDLPLSELKLGRYAIRAVSPLDPSGWIRVVLAPKS